MKQKEQEKITLAGTDLSVSKVAMGGIPIMRLNKKEAVEVIKSVLKMGVNFIDTANAYDDLFTWITPNMLIYRMVTAERLP